jgi:DNA-binding LacI/PurR family transcriptional regulator
LAQHIVDLAIGRIGGLRTAPVDVTVDPELVVRTSTAPPRTGS